MKLVTLQAKIDFDKCISCRNCVKVCPTLAIKMDGSHPVVDLEKCAGCGNCEQRCPTYAIVLEKRATPRKLYVDPDKADRKKVDELCRKAKFNPEQIICYCTETRAEEIAAAVLLGAKSPEDLSVMTGVRTGCCVECIQPMLRILKAAGIDPVRQKDGWQWYGLTPTIWDIPDNVKEKYNKKGFYFDEDIKLLDKVVDKK